MNESTNDQKNSSYSADKLRVEISWKSLLKVPVVTLGCYMLYLLLPFIMLLFLSALLAVTFEPLVVHLEKQIGRKPAVGLISAFTLVVIAAVCLLVVPELISQVSSLYEKFPDLLQSVKEKFPALAGVFNHIPKRMESVDPASVSPFLKHLAEFGAAAVGSLSSIVLIFAFMVYLLLDGARVYNWLIAFFTLKTRVKINETCVGIAPVISAYVIGQIVTSSLCTVFTYVLLRSLGVPAALVLAVLAGIFDILPIIGFFMFAIPAALFALTVSTNTALITVFLFGVYHLVETYLVSPLVYGNRLQVSGIVVLSTLIAGGTVGGIMGAIVILPIVASYPVIEKIWLKQFLGKRVIARHEHSDDNAEFEP